MRKSYHSMVVPIALAATTARIETFFSTFSVAGSEITHLWPSGDRF
jgi:hypothetical protein